MVIPHGAVVEVPLDLYVNPQHVRDNNSRYYTVPDGTFTATIWLGSQQTPLSYRDRNPDNNSIRVDFPVTFAPQLIINGNVYGKE